MLKFIMGQGKEKAGLFRNIRIMVDAMACLSHANSKQSALTTAAIAQAAVPRLADKPSIRSKIINLSQKRKERIKTLGYNHCQKYCGFK